MSVRRNMLALVLAFLAAMAGVAASAQGFAGLGNKAEGFEMPRAGYTLRFPADHGAHPAYRIEWWYLTANLVDADGREYGVQWTLFRSALRPPGDDGPGTGWQNPQIWFGHAALTTPDLHLFAERFARGGIGQAGVDASPFRAWIDDWAMTSTAETGKDALSALTLSARGDGFSYQLNLRATGPLVLHGQDGYSVKSREGQASYYYSQPGYEVSGILSLPGGDVAVTGQGWLDREWSSQPLAADQTGWDWFSLSFETGARMMGFRLRDAGAGFTSATWIAPDGGSTALPDGALQLEPLEYADVAGRRIPVRWRLVLASRGVDIEVSALNPQSWMGTAFPYWEGPVRVRGSHPGRGYLEMTGYGTDR
jgi:predicted secreted hydrolase